MKEEFSPQFIVKAAQAVTPKMLPTKSTPCNPDIVDVCIPGL